MKIILCPASFKGSLTASEATEAMRDGIIARFPNVEIQSLPLADGGEGTLEVIFTALQGEQKCLAVPGPYGTPVKAEYLISKGVAFIELAQASGLTLEQSKTRTPLIASTYGTGLMIKDALASGVATIYVTLGGSATNDGGAGIARALGIRILDQLGEEVEPNCRGLTQAVRIDASDFKKRTAGVSFIFACDVKNKAWGELGASHIFGPQKGADSAMVEEMDKVLKNYCDLLKKHSGRDVGEMEGGGAAGGAALPLLAFSDCAVISGIDMILDLVGFDEAIKGAAAVYTGEGKVDAQTGFGKAVSGVYARSRKADVPVHVFAGQIEERAYEGEELYYHPISLPGCTMAYNMEHAYENLKVACEKCTGEILRGMVS